MKRICRSFIKNTILKLNILDIVSHYLSNGKPSGNTSMFCCPFHADKTPSMGVKAIEGYYNCFSCHAAGNLIQFVMNYRNIGYEEAIEEISYSQGISVVYREVSPEEEESIKILETLNDVQNIYHQSLISPLAFSFLQKRGIKVSSQQTYSLGYGVDLDDELKQQYIDAGIYHLTDSKECFHIFKKRITFPIRGPKGDILGFGGRSIGNTHPKYINSSETLLFKKSKCVYGLYEVLQRSHKRISDGKQIPHILLVEGYFDVISLGQANINAVACMGTTITTFQLEKIYHYTNKIIVCMDGDPTGARASLAILRSFAHLQHKKELFYCALPDGEDPDSFILNYGVEKFKKFISDNCLELHEYFVHITKDTNLFLTLHNAEAILKNLPSGYCKVSLAHHFIKHHKIPLYVLSGDSSMELGSAINTVIRPNKYNAPQIMDDILKIVLHTSVSQKPKLQPGMLTKEHLVIALILQYPEECNSVLLEYDLDTLSSYLRSFLKARIDLDSNDIEILQSYLIDKEYDIIGLHECNISFLGNPKNCLSQLLNTLGKYHPLLSQVSNIFPSVKTESQRALIAEAYRKGKIHFIPLLLAHEQHDQDK